jgi:hypothetical protein
MFYFTIFNMHPLTVATDRGRKNSWKMSVLISKKPMTYSMVGFVLGCKGAVPEVETNVST